MSNERAALVRNNGECVEAMTPVVVSASRSTDIPAFYAKWFFNRLHWGYCVWINPFNQKPSYVSFKNCRAIVFWTKNPKPVIPYLNELDERGIHYYFQVTLNDYEREGFEPNVPPLDERIDTFKELSGRIGKDRVVWRFDPIMVTPDLTPRDLLKRIWRIGNRLMGYTEKLVFSFIDVQPYKKVQASLVRATKCFTKESVVSAELTTAQRREVVGGLLKMQAAWREKGWNVTLATCGEEADFAGIEHNRCIDGELLARISGDDPMFLYYLKTGKLVEPDLFGSMPPLPAKDKDLKDKGQRLACGCMVSKDIGMYNTCRHFCVYCYANTSRECVLKNAEKHSDESESIIS